MDVSKCWDEAEKALSPAASGVILGAQLSVVPCVTIKRRNPPWDSITLEHTVATPLDGLVVECVSAGSAPAKKRGDSCSGPHIHTNHSTLFPTQHRNRGRPLCYPVGLITAAPHTWGIRTSSCYSILLHTVLQGPPRPFCPESPTRASWDGGRACSVPLLLVGILLQWV